VKLQNQQLLYTVLSTVANVAVALSKHPARTSGSLYRALREFDALQTVSREQLRNVSNYIVAKKYVTIRRDKGGLAQIAVTNAGQVALQTHALRALKPATQKVWDRKWRIVLFDIPNRSKSARDAFAGTLKRIGFVPIQKSVFVFPYPCEEELEVIADYYDIQENIEIIVAERLTHDGELKRLFKL
jgi:DNA-binding transcriptional regulator PaaX